MLTLATESVYDYGMSVIHFWTRRVSVLFLCRASMERCSENTSNKHQQGKGNTIVKRTLSLAKLVHTALIGAGRDKQPCS
jgi:hypothetical protein